MSARETAGSTMQPWQVEFVLAPRAAASPARGASKPPLAWPATGSAQRTLASCIAALGLLPPARADADERSWGRADGNRVDVMRAADGQASVRVAVDTRQLDPKFAAGLLALVRAVDGVLIRADGLVIDGTVGAFTAALRSAPAWRFVRDPTGLLTGRPPADEDVDDA